MGLFDMLGNSLSSKVAGAAANAAGQAKPAQPAAPNYADIVGQSNKVANDYRQRMPELQAGQRGVLMDQGRRDLASAYTNADRRANRRGMFYGGIRGGLRSGAEGDVAEGVANKIRGVNVDSEDTARGIENTALEAGFGLKDDTQKQYQNEYNEALSRRQQRQDQLNAILGGASSIAGLVAGGGLLGGAADSKLGSGTSAAASYRYGGV